MSPESPERAALRAATVRALTETPGIIATLSSLPMPPVVPAGPPERGLSGASEKLERLVDVSLDKLGDALEINPDSYEEDESRLSAWRVIVSACEKILNTQVRVDQNRLRKRQVDKLGEVLDELNRTERSLPPVRELDLSAG